MPAGDSRALVGRNGAGKSTLVGVLTGILAPDAGRVRFAGQDAPGLAERQKWRDRVACVYQKSTLVPTLTVAENLLLNAQPTGGLGWIRWGAARREAERVLAGWGMELDVEQDCARLSVEQRQIVEIARALIQGDALHHPGRAHRRTGRPRGAAAVRPHHAFAGRRRHLPVYLALP